MKTDQSVMSLKICFDTYLTVLPLKGSLSVGLSQNFVLSLILCNEIKLNVKFLAKEFSISICCQFIGFGYCAIHGVSVLSNYLQPMSLTKTKT